MAGAQVAGTGLIALEWWDLPTLLLMVFWSLTASVLVICIIFVVLLPQNQELPTFTRALIYLWLALGVLLLGALAAIIEVPVLKEVLPKLSQTVFVIWGFIVVAYVLTTIVIGVVRYSQKSAPGRASTPSPPISIP